MNVLLLNDTGIKSHIGCQAVSDAHARMLGRLGHKVAKRYFVNELNALARPTLRQTISAIEQAEHVVQAIRDADAVVVNGEGTIHHNKGLELLGVLAIAVSRGKPALLVNALFQDMTIDLSEMPQLDTFAVRDFRSLEYAKSLGRRCSFAPDSIIEAGFDSVARQNLREAVVVTDWVKARDHDVGALCADYLATASCFEEPEFYPLHVAGAWSHWASAKADLATAGVLVSARHHGNYLAMLNGLPFVPMASNSWKIEGTLESVGLPVRIPRTRSEVEMLIKEVQASRQEFSDARERLLAQRPLGIFDILGKAPGPSRELEEVRVLKDDVANHDRKSLQNERLSLQRRRGREAELRRAAHAKANRKSSGPLVSLMESASSKLYWYFKK